MRAREACGCVHDGHKWVSMCEPCAVEFNERHVQAAIDHAERQPSEQVDPLGEAPKL